MAVQQSVIVAVLSEDDSIVFSASKDGSIRQSHLDHDHGGKTEETLYAQQGSKHVLALAVTSDGRYLASAGFDRDIHLWDTRTRRHIQAFSGHKGPISCLTFRQGTSELFSGLYDRTIKIWNTEDRSYVTTLFGHQSHVLSIDCLRKERVLTAARDRTMHLWKGVSNLKWKSFEFHLWKQEVHNQGRSTRRNRDNKSILECTVQYVDCSFSISAVFMAVQQ
ncbi:putative transcription factor WD40-like family [Helianthus annuus]|nr:putative transcription factor WD40-like family [Helianthus annuus]